MCSQRHTVSNVLEKIVHLHGLPEGSVVRGRPASDEAILALEARCGFEVPAGIKELLRFSDGMQLAGLKILSAAEIYVEHPKRGGKFLVFHAWENGDADGVVVGEPVKKRNGTIAKPSNVVFINRSADRFALMNRDLIDWLLSVDNEIRYLQFIRHPMDYLKPGVRRIGMYVPAIYLFERPYPNDRGSADGR